ncbi:MAG: hypothetical protein GY761_03200 [Hyphomicrobiales bacterium]|nr:hypothetical protein [Hyphomicrobiales bacterium]
MTTHYRDSAGNYLGGYDGSDPPAGAIECSVPPDGRAVWIVDTWVLDQSAIDDEQKEHALGALTAPSSYDKAIGAVLFELVNIVRVEVQGKSPLTASTFRNYIKGKM